MSTTGTTAGPLTGADPVPTGPAAGAGTDPVAAAGGDPVVLAAAVVLSRYSGAPVVTLLPAGADPVTVRVRPDGPHDGLAAV
ncbi:MAG TPA: hypothetical protein VGD67_18055, partial [Pseudonocardiaceae bacterium]